MTRARGPARHRRLGIGVLVASLAWSPATGAAGAATHPGGADGADGAALDCGTVRAVATLPASARYGYVTDLLAPGGRPAWLVGMSAGRRHPARPIALRWSDGRWRETDVGWSGAVSGITGVDGDRASAWAVGYARPGASLRPMVARWADGRWSALRPKVLPASGVALAAVVALEDGAALVAGAAYRRGRVQAVGALFRAGRWSRVDPFPRGADGAVVALAAEPGGHVWAVGWRMAAGRPQPMMAEFDGAAWSRVGTTGSAASSGSFTDVAVDPDGTPWVVGYTVDPATGRHAATLQGWNGTSWVAVPTPWGDGRSLIPRALAVRAGGTWTVAGQIVAGDRVREGGFAASGGPAGWRFEPVGRPAGRHWELLDVALVDGVAVISGGVSNKVVVRPWCEGAEAAAAAQAGPSMSVAEPAQAGSARVRPGAVDRGRYGRSTDTRAARVGFRDVAAARGVGITTSTWGAVTADLDRDGWPDLVIGRHNIAPPLVLRGGPGGFRPMRQARLPTRDLHGCAIADVDRDGHPDIHCAVGANHGMITKSNQLWLHPGAGRPSPAAASWGIVDPFGRGRASVFLDADRDGFPDLFVTSEPERVDGLPSLDRLFLSSGGAGFRAAPEAGLDLPIGGTGVAAGDLDGDGDDDLVVTGAAPAPGGTPGLRLFVNEDGRFVEHRTWRGIEPMGDVDVLLADLDGDDRMDIAQLGRGRLRVSIATDDGFQRRFELAVSAGVAIAGGDADGDGDTDLYVQRGGRGNGADLLLLAGADGRRYSAVRIPQARGGSADDVIVLDHDRNGTADFLVLNGFMGWGPVQLIAARSR